MIVTRTSMFPGRLIHNGSFVEEVLPDDRADSKRVLLPGLTDIHAHGAGGRSFNSSSREDWRNIRELHWSRGTTSMVATIATDHPSRLRDAVAAGSPEVSSGRILGIHLEGPYLAPGYRGAHPSAYLSEPDDMRWKGWDPQPLSMLTIAPELAGSEELIQWAAQHGIMVAAGHTSITRIDHPDIEHVSHLWSGHSRLRIRQGHRTEGLLEQVLASDELTTELIADGHHVTKAMLKIAYKCLGPDRISLVSDASAGTGCANGTKFTMGGVRGVVQDGKAHSLDGTSLCGSTAFLVDVLSFCVRAGICLVDSIRMATTTPASRIGHLVGIEGLGPGYAGPLLSIASIFSKTPEVQVVYPRKGRHDV